MSGTHDKLYSALCDHFTNDDVAIFRFSTHYASMPEELGVRAELRRYNLVPAALLLRGIDQLRAPMEMALIIAESIMAAMAIFARPPPAPPSSTDTDAQSETAAQPVRVDAATALSETADVTAGSGSGSGTATSESVICGDDIVPLVCGWWGWRVSSTQRPSPNTCRAFRPHQLQAPRCITLLLSVAPCSMQQRPARRWPQGENRSVR